MSKYFLRFFIYLVAFTMLAGILAALLPQGIGQVLTAFPFLMSSVLLLFHFLKRERRAPSNSERNRFSLIYVLIFFLYNYVFAVVGPLIFNLNIPNVLNVWFEQAFDLEFQLMLISRLLIFMIPFYIVVFWFYGPQAKRMAAKMFSSEKQ
jgi:lysylphosphatidylglycerol synthetase-like protein (DUF2156 family)